ncbi:nuclear transport factor 2 family protein [Bradyrhizobium septentrionale]|uniref:Nuclear transport factor 2 family protein n=1 Tax=Bradyrhizobium septentrionale TaxID=1404411 RepID=A0ABZ2P7T5_9BRAD
MSVIETISHHEAMQLMKANETNFGAKDMKSIMAGFTEDVIVKFGDFPEIRGKEQLREFLCARFARMTDYRLSKTLDVVSDYTIVNSWDGTWQDSKTGLSMEGRGIEVWRVTSDRKCDFWSATFNVWQSGNPGQLPII